MKGVYLWWVYNLDLLIAARKQMTFEYSKQQHRVGHNNTIRRKDFGRNLAKKWSIQLRFMFLRVKFYFQFLGKELRTNSHIPDNFPFFLFLNRS